MSLDPRLADPSVLVPAAIAARQRRASPPTRAVTLRIVYEAFEDEPEYEVEGPTYLYEQTADGWQPVPGYRT